jgi:hypothetical protein
MKRFERKDRSAPPASTRTGPRARAAQERKFADPYAHADRPARFGPRAEGAAPRRSAVITLDPDVARVFRNSEAVNEALRLVMRLARFGGGTAASFNRDRPRPSPAPAGRFAREKPRERPPLRRDRKFGDKE